MLRLRRERYTRISVHPVRGKQCRRVERNKLKKLIKNTILLRCSNIESGPNSQKSKDHELEEEGGGEEGCVDEEEDDIKLKDQLSGKVSAFLSCTP